MDGRILWWQTFIAQLGRIRDASKRWRRDVTVWQPVRRYTGYVHFEITETTDNESEA